MKQYRTSRRSANCGVPFFIVEKSVVIVYNKLHNFSGVTGDYGKLEFVGMRNGTGFVLLNVTFSSLSPRLPLRLTVVKHPDFYYHLTTIDGCDLPHLAVFCFFRDRVTDY